MGASDKSPTSGCIRLYPGRWSRRCFYSCLWLFMSSLGLSALNLFTSETAEQIKSFVTNGDLRDLITFICVFKLSSCVVVVFFFCSILFTDLIHIIFVKFLLRCFIAFWENNSCKCYHGLWEKHLKCGSSLVSSVTLDKPKPLVSPDTHPFPHLSKGTDTQATS